MIFTSTRSSINSGLNRARTNVTSVFELSNPEKIIIENGYPGWAPNPKSSLVEIAVQTWKEMFADKTEGRKKGFFLFFFFGLNFDCFQFQISS